jgi:hypothetical protein
MPSSIVRTAPPPTREEWNLLYSSTRNTIMKLENRVEELENELQEKVEELKKLKEQTEEQTMAKLFKKMLA